MRRASHNTQWIVDDWILRGIALGSDFCAEHEWGVDTLKQRFGCDSTLDGVERRMIRTVPDGLKLMETPKLFYISLTGSKWGREPKGWLDEEMRQYHDEPLVCAWSEELFGIAIYGDEAERYKGRQLWEAFQAKDVCFWTSIGPFHLGGGLIFAITSRLREADKEAMLEGDLSQHRLEAAVKATGIVERLRGAAKGYFALTPRWINDAEDGLHFWLNPSEHRRYNSGYFTVEELGLWAEDKGPVMKR